MRISTAQLYNVNVGTMNRQESSLLHLQQQLSLGRRVLSPSDDPVAAARALEVSQAVSQTNQHVDNQGTAKDALTTLESKLAAASELIMYARERAIQAGNGALNADDRRVIAQDMRAQFDNLMAVANSVDANGEYLFSGYQGDTVAFAGSLLGGVTYQGDQGERTLQLSNSRLLPISQSGEEVFMRVDNLNGRFNTRPAATNSGGAIINDGTVTGTYTNGQYGIRFTAPGTYAIFDTAPAPGMTGAPLTTAAYTSGAAIDLPPLPAAAQIQVSISGTPATGDTFTVNPGGNTDMFTIVQQFVLALENVSGTEFHTAMTETLGRLDNSLDNVLRLRAQVGSRQVEVEALTNVSEDQKLQYAERLDRLTGLNYTEAISNLQLEQTYLDASRRSFSRITELSLFDFLG